MAWEGLLERAQHAFRVFAFGRAPEIEQGEEGEGALMLARAPGGACLFSCGGAGLQVRPIGQMRQRDHGDGAALGQGLSGEAAGAPDLVVALKKSLPTGGELLQFPGPVADAQWCLELMAFQQLGIAGQDVGVGVNQIHLRGCRACTRLLDRQGLHGGMAGQGQIGVAELAAGGLQAAGGGAGAAG